MINGNVSPMSPLAVQRANLHAGPSESLTHHSQPCLQTGSAPSVLAARAIFVCLVFLVGRFVYFAADTLLLQYSDCLPERHGLFLRLRRGRRSAAAPRCCPGAVAAAAPPDPPAASSPVPARSAAPPVRSRRPPGSPSGSLLSPCPPSFICRAPGLYCLSASLSLCLSLSPRPRSVVRPGPQAAPRSGSAARRLRARCAQRRCPGCRCPGCRTAPAGPGAIALPALTPPQPAPCTARDARPGRCLCGGRLCLSVCPPARAAVASRTSTPPVTLFPPLPSSPPPSAHPQPGAERQSTRAGLIRRKLVDPLRFLVICSHPLPVAPDTRPPRKIKREGNGP
ncbi:uncharacterized protein LOC143694118 [Agelaius phoeniceus]|uniref:uncharacterized protein LOC143694118 n=1 Tax=Agelaius phoeniceus TaxID=39638 RepID=UPI004054B6B0